MSEPTTEQAISKLASVLSTSVFDKKGISILDNIKNNPIKGESDAEHGLRLGLAVMFSEVLRPPTTGESND